MNNQATQPVKASSPTSQGQAVIQAIRDVLKADFKEGTKVVLSDDQRKLITDILVKGFTERRIPLKASAANEAKLADPKKLHGYVKGLINNWLTKSPMLNGKPRKLAPVKAVPVEDKATDATSPKKSAAVSSKK
jgi:hypothetical protein